MHKTHATPTHHDSSQTLVQLGEVMNERSKYRQRKNEVLAMRRRSEILVPNSQVEKLGNQCLTKYAADKQGQQAFHAMDKYSGSGAVELLGEEVG